MITDHSDVNDKVDGGVQAVTKYLVEALIKFEAIDLHVLSFKYDIDKIRSSSERGYTRHVLPGARFGTATGYRRDQRTLNACLQEIRPDAVHGQGAGHNGIMASRSSFASVITIHGIMAQEARFFSGAMRRVRHWILSKISDRYCIRGGTHTILISPYVAEYFNERLAGSRYVIPNPIADAFFNITRRDDGRRILFAGRLLPLKGVKDLITAVGHIASSQDIKLVLAGSLSESQYVEQLKNEATRLGISENVHFLGLLSEEQLRNELSRSAALVLPSYQETAPMVIVEAMAAGVPVIATNVGGVSYDVMDGITGFLIEPGDVHMLAERLRRLLSDPTLRRSFGDTAKEIVIEKNRARKVAERTIEVYRQALAC